jgi:hypothetical protein
MLRFALPAAVAALFLQAAAAQTPPTTQVSEIPDNFVMPTAQNDYVRRIEMIPMRDGVNSEGCDNCADRTDPHAIQREGAHLERQSIDLRGTAGDRSGFRARGLHPRVAGYSGQVRFGGRL